MRTTRQQINAIARCSRDCYRTKVIARLRCHLKTLDEIHERHEQNKRSIMSLDKISFKSRSYSWFSEPLFFVWIVLSGHRPRNRSFPATQSFAGMTLSDPSCLILYYGNKSNAKWTSCNEVRRFQLGVPLTLTQSS